ncbi:MAG: hypothetical protein KDD89_14600 [Anaerolineales bacterium]|nr:hypothetical protein [Anaerolineales bacterium]
MKLSRFHTLFLALCAAWLLLSLSACGGGNVTVADLPTYPDAVRLQAGEDPIADTLAQNMAQNAAMTSGMGGLGGSIEQVAFRLPAGTTWDDLNGFLSRELKAAGWSEGMGGPGGNLASQALASANAGNDMVQTGMWNKGKQILTVYRLTDPNNVDQPYLIVSLNTN